ncbi:MAG: VWA domain-containing protein [Vicinamibacterales bacterium]
MHPLLEVGLEHRQLVQVRQQGWAEARRAPPGVVVARRVWGGTWRDGRIPQWASRFADQQDTLSSRLPFGGARIELARRQAFPVELSSGIPGHSGLETQSRRYRCLSPIPPRSEAAFPTLGGRRERSDAPRRPSCAWAGGASIGACLRDFLRRYGDRWLGRDTIVMIASDGLDAGAPDILRDAMRELHRRSAGIIWVNPLLETPGYEPIASGMRAARPYSTFTSVTDPASLRRLSRVIRVRS